MSEPASISSGIAKRYATAIFEIAQEDGSLDRIAEDARTIRSALDESDAFRDLINSPIYSREAQEAGIAALAERMELSDTVRNTLRLMATKRRLFVLPALVDALQRMIAEARGEVSADVTSARPLGDDQRSRLSETLKSAMGRDVALNASVDEGLIGGLVVKVGSRMIDTSIRSKLNALRNTMKEVG